MHESYEYQTVAVADYDALSADCRATLFGQAQEISRDTVRLSVDKTLFVVKADGNNCCECGEEKIVEHTHYNRSEVLALMQTEAWLTAE